MFPMQNSSAINHFQNKASLKRLPYAGEQIAFLRVGEVSGQQSSYCVRDKGIY